MDTKNINNFSAKVFRAYNKDLDAKNPTICKMLVNYKWSVKHLQQLDEAYANNAIEQFNKVVKQFGVKLEKPAEKATEKPAKQ